LLLNSFSLLNNPEMVYSQPNQENSNDYFQVEFFNCLLCCEFSLVLLLKFLGFGMFTLGSRVFLLGSCVFMTMMGLYLT